MTEKLKIMQFNVQSLIKNLDIIRYESIIKIGADLLIICETFTKNEFEKVEYNISGYHKIIKSRGDGYGGIAIYLKNKFKYRKLDIGYSHNIERLAIEIINFNITIVSLYINKNASLNELEINLLEIKNKLQTKQKILIAGDINAKHSAWGNELDERKGEIILEWINNNNWMILNTGQHTHHPIGQKSSAIDISICTPNIFNEICWKVEDYGIGKCKHNIINMTVEINEIREPKILDKKKFLNEIKKIQSNKIVDIDDLQTDIIKI